MLPRHAPSLLSPAWLPPRALAARPDTRSCRRGAEALEDRDAARLAARDLQLLEHLDRKSPLDEFVRRAETGDPAAENDHFLWHGDPPQVSSAGFERKA